MPSPTPGPRPRSSLALIASSPVTYPLLITADGHLTGNINPPTNPAGLPEARIVLEPAGEPGRAGRIAYFGPDYPVRLLVQEAGGKRRGYLHWTDQQVYPAVSQGPDQWKSKVVLAEAPDPVRSVWLIELYARRTGS